MTGLYRHECSSCGEIAINDDFDMESCPACDDKYATMLSRPSPEHDSKIMKEPPDSLACPECGSKLFAISTETGKDWVCWQEGGCQFSGWRREVEEMPAPEDIPNEQAHRQSAWSRYHRHKQGHFEYK
jgi:predicted RNA-binding Zn-ribbon protein involved in translation (DUF1610 family)